MVPAAGWPRGDDSLQIICRPMLAKPTQAEWVEFIGYVGQQAAELMCELVIFDTIGTFARGRTRTTRCG